VNRKRRPPAHRKLRDELGTALSFNPRLTGQGDRPMTGPPAETI